MTNNTTLTRLYLTLITISGLFLVGYVLTTGEIQDVLLAFTFRYRAAAVLGMLGVLTICALSVFGVIISFRSQERYQRVLTRWKEFLDRPKAVNWIIAGCLGIAYLITNFLLQINQVVIPFPLMLLTLFRPFLGWTLGICLLSIPLILLLARKGRILTSADILRPLVIFLFLLILGLLITRSGYGYERTSPEGGFFRPTAYPIVGYQVVFALLGLGLYLLADNWLVRRLGDRYQKFSWLVDAGIIILGAFFLWQSAPVEQNPFVDILRPPNMENYPGLDAIFYDRGAQNLLATGNMGSYLTDDLKSTIARRPLLILFYAGLHRLAGLGMKEILPYQLVLFTTFPFLVYLFTKQISNRAAGLLTATLTIIRGWNGLQLGSEVTGTNLQMVMSDYPAAIGVVLFLYLSVIWLKDRPQSPVIPLIMGGVLGATMLIRQEVGEMIVPAGLVALILLRKKPAKLLQGGLTIVLGILLVISPWMARNYHVSGKAYLDAPWSSGFFRQTLKQLQSEYLNSEPALFTEYPNQEQPEISSAHQSALINPGEMIAWNDAGTGLTDQNMQVGDNPRVGVILNHLANSTLQSMLYLPSRTVILDVDYLTKAVNQDLNRVYGGVIYNLEDFIHLIPYWRWEWNGQIITQSILPLGMALLLIAVGISSVWKRRNWLVFLPILAFLVHIGVYALIRRSGGRFLLQVDWITAMFYSIGLVQLTSWMIKGRGMPELKEKIAPNHNLDSNMNPSQRRVLLLAITVGFLLLGTAPVAAERLSSNPYTNELLDQKLSSALDKSNSPWTSEKREGIREFLDNGGEAHYGRALYPRYFLPGGEMIDTVEIYWENTTTFFITGTIFDYVILPGEEPAYFPHGADVLVIGCPDSGGSYEKDVCLHCDQGGLDALAVVIYDPEGEGIMDVLWREGAGGEGSEGCPLP